MTDLQFAVLDARPAERSASPAVLVRLAATESTGAHVWSITLHVHAWIEPRARRYSADEQRRVYELFGPPAQWDRSLRPVSWARTTTAVPAFRDRTEFDLSIPCTYDLEVGAAKYLHAIREGEVAVRLLFTGTIFTAGEHGVSIEQVPWDREVVHRVPARLWSDAMDRHFPGCGWIRLRRETLDALLAFKGREALITWDDTIERLLLPAGRTDVAETS